MPLQVDVTPGRSHGTVAPHWKPAWNEWQADRMDADDPIVGENALPSKAADRLDELAETAELMGDTEGAHQWRERALAVRMAAMKLLDD